MAPGDRAAQRAAADAPILSALRLDSVRGAHRRLRPHVRRHDRVGFTPEFAAELQKPDAQDTQADAQGRGTFRAREAGGA